MQNLRGKKMQETKTKKALLSIKNFFIKLWNYYTLYEKIWFLSITILAFVFAFVFPEEDIGGVNGKVIMALYLLNIFTNILCELLISKQSKWNFLVSLIVEASEIAILIICSFRFATMAATIFFWIPIDIISFFVWHKHPDKKETELTEVRKLSGWQRVAVIIGIIVWTVGIGYLLTLIDTENGILSSQPTLEKICCYLDACCSAVGIANGLFILFRYQEQWIAWYIVTFLEIALNIISGMWVLLVLKAGYLTNTTYGYIKWNKYIKAHQKTDAQSDDGSDAQTDDGSNDKNSSSKVDAITDGSNNAHPDAQSNDITERQTDYKTDHHAIDKGTQNEVILDANTDDSLNVQTAEEAIEATATSPILQSENDIDELNKAQDELNKALSDEISTDSEADLTGTSQQENAPTIINGTPQNSPQDTPAT